MARQSRLSGVYCTLTLVTRADLISKPRNEFRASNIKLLLGNEAPDLKAPFLAILLGNDDPAMVMVFILREELFKRGGIDS
jgi:hypothetical protein